MGAQRFYRRALRTVGAAAVSVVVVVMPAVGTASAQSYGPQLGSSGGQPGPTTPPSPGTGSQGSPQSPSQSSSQQSVLAFTGAEIAGLTGAGAAAIGAGGFLVLATRRRRHQPA